MSSNGHGHKHEHEMIEFEPGQEPQESPQAMLDVREVQIAGCLGLRTDGVHPLIMLRLGGEYQHHCEHEDHEAEHLDIPAERSPAIMFDIEAAEDLIAGVREAIDHLRKRNWA